MQITTNTIKKYLAEYQLQVLREQEDVLQEIIKDTVALVRAEVSNNPANVLSADVLSVPEALSSATCHLIIEALQSRIPAIKLSKDQVRNADNARKLLERIAKKELTLTAFAPRKGENAITHQSSERQATRNSLKGL